MNQHITELTASVRVRLVPVLVLVFHALVHVQVEVFVRNEFSEENCS